MSSAVIAMLFALCGLAVGGAYFALVKRTARQVATGEVRVAGMVGAVGLRMLLFAPGAVVAAMLSLIVLAGYMLGFIGARVLATNAWKKP